MCHTYHSMASMSAVLIYPLIKEVYNFVEAMSPCSKISEVNWITINAKLSVNTHLQYSVKTSRRGDQDYKNTAHAVRN